MIRLLFTKSRYPLSKLITWGFNEPCSHFAICFDDRVVFHSNLKGAHVDWKTTFLKSSEIIKDINMALSLEQEEMIYQNCIAIDKKPYDYGAFLFLCIDVLLFKLFKTPMKKHNVFASDGSFLCTELAQCLNPVVQVSTLGELDTISPYQLYLKLEERLVC